MSEENVNLEIDSRGVATLTLARAKKLNALTPQMMRDFISHLETVRDREARVLVITGKGAAFCAGMDIDAESEEGAIETVKNLLAAVDDCPVATIAKVRGYAMGGGLGIAAATDFVVASDDARFGMPELRIGMAPLLVSAYASRRLGWATARRWALSASHFSADSAFRDRFVDHLSSAETVDEQVERVIADILKTAPQASKAAKRFIRSQSGPNEAIVGEALKQSAALTEKQEARSGADAFYKRETPPWAI